MMADTEILSSASVLDEGIPALLAKYNKRFDSAIPVPADYPTTDLEGLKAFAKAITSNLVGGIGYFYGTSIVNKGFRYEWDKEEDDTSDGSSDIDEGVSTSGDGSETVPSTAPSAFMRFRRVLARAYPRQRGHVRKRYPFVGGMS